MTEERNSLSPETDDAAPKLEYNDLKYPLLQRGIPLPAGLEDYINARIQRDMLTDSQIEAIRREMMIVFTDAGLNVPDDFQENFEKWFPRA